ncbi:MAG: hypothetical protein K8S97_07345 [Anaerolineae bacterium]|nr:hypothetical protein [Anaerolineae bacterium]
MYTKRVSPHPPTGSAGMARARLMHDPTTRRNTGRTQPSTVPARTPKLSAADQKHQVLNVLRSFERFHLANLFYDTAQQTTTATIRPDLDHHDVPHAIQIDAQGNLRVTRLGPSYTTPPRWQNWQRKLLSSMAFVVLFTALLLLLT